MADTKAKREARARQAKTGERYTDALAGVKQKHKEDTILAQAEEIRRRRGEERVQQGLTVEERINAVLGGDRTRAFTDDELRYAATARCPCGAGLAYVKGGPMRGCWDCSAILKGEAAFKGEPGSVEHTDRLPFMFWKIRSEDDGHPATRNRTTRPTGGTGSI